MYIVKKTRNNKCWQGCGEKGTQYNIISHKKKEILPFATTWMKLEDITLNEISPAKTHAT